MPRAPYGGVDGAEARVEVVPADVQERVLLEDVGDGFICCGEVLGADGGGDSVDDVEVRGCEGAEEEVLDFRDGGVGVWTVGFHVVCDVGHCVDEVC